MASSGAFHSFLAFSSVSMSKLIALVPARGGSKGLPNKNILDLHGRPLINWSIAFAQAQACIDRCIVSTDSVAIAEIAKKCGAEVPFLRSEALSTDDAKTADVIIDVINRCSLDKDDIIILLEPTSPFRTKPTFGKLLSLLNYPDFKKAVSVSEAVSTSHVFQYSINFNSCPIMRSVSNGVNVNGLRRQDIGKSYYLDGSFYVTYVHAFLDEPGFLGPNTLAVLSDYFSSFEVDCENDFRLMRAIFSHVGLPF